MAALSSIRLYDLIERFFGLQREPTHRIFALERPQDPAIRRLVEKDHPTAEKTDKEWLQRLELRRSNWVITVLERSRFREQRGKMLAMFVDGRCGLIRSFPIGCTAACYREGAAGKILAQASNCHAAGMILATNDLDGKFASAPRWSKLVSDLYHKGEATEIFLLDHFVLTRDGWNRMFAFNKQASGDGLVQD